MDEKFPESVAAVKAELKRLETELRAADGNGDRRTALNILATMLQLQKRFMRQWGKKDSGEQTPSPDDVHADPGTGPGR